MKFIKNWVIPIAVGLLIAYIIQFWFVTVRVKGPSMEPNLVNNQFVIESRKANIKRGDVIVFDARHEDPNNKSDHKDYVKRVIGVSDDRVEHKGSNLYVNGKLVDQDYIGLTERSSGTWGDWSLTTLSKSNTWQAKDRNQSVVPKNSYFVLGDHRSVSNDSRTFGFVEKKHVNGKVIVPFWNTDKTAKGNVNEQSKRFFDK